MGVLEVLGVVFLALGGITMLVGAFGVVRFPDFYTRLHAAGKGDTLGQGLALFGLLLIAGVSIDGLKLMLIIGFVLILNATATHALARAGWLAGLKPWLGEAGEVPPQQEGQMSAADRVAVIAPVPAAPALDGDEEEAPAIEASPDADSDTAADDGDANAESDKASEDADAPGDDDVLEIQLDDEPETREGDAS